MLTLCLVLTYTAAFFQTDTAAADPALAATVNRYVRNLDSQELESRDAAEKAILELGPKALPLLPKDNKGLPAEVADRLTRIRKQLQTRAAVDWASATKVTMQGEQKLSAVLAEVEKQTGNKLIDYRGRFGQAAEDVTLKLDLKDATFWEAMKEICSQAKLEMYPYVESEGAVGLVESDGSAESLSTSTGAFQILPRRVLAIRDLTTADGGGVTIETTVSWEPRLKPIVLRVPFESVTATDDTGKTHQLPDVGSIEIPAEGLRTSAEAGFRLPLLGKAETLKAFKGELQAVIPGSRELFQFEALDKVDNTQQIKGGVRVSLESVRKQGELLDVRVRVQFEEAAEALDSHYSWVFGNEATLIPEKGEPMEYDGLETYRRSGDEIGIVYRYYVEDKTAADFKFHYTTPTTIVEVKLPFELKDIPLP